MKMGLFFQLADHLDYRTKLPIFFNMLIIAMFPLAAHATYLLKDCFTPAISVSLMVNAFSKEV